VASRYINKFFALKCAPDVLATVGHVAQMEKELTEAMGLLRHIQRIVLRDQRSYRIFDLCAGNALTSVLAVHLFPRVDAVAIDKLPREREWYRAKRFAYASCDIYQDFAHFPGLLNDKPIIVVGCHACGDLAERVIEFYRQYGDYLVLLPCCRGKILSLPALLRDRLNSYDQWAYTLYRQAAALSSRCDAVEDPYIQSPKNIIITARK
jgi:hypothetical protein